MTRLIVEDDAVLAMVSMLALEEAGHTIVGLAHDLESFEHLAERNDIDLAVVDINLAGANEGLLVAERLRAHCVCVLFVSGQLGAARENSHLAFGLLRKPYEIEDLLGSVKYIQNVLFGKTPSSTRPSTLEVFEPNQLL